MSSGIDPALFVVRIAAFGLAILVFGAAAFDLYAPTQRGPRGWRIGAAALLALAAIAYVGLIARDVGGTGGWPDASAVWMLWTATGFGMALAAAAIAGVALALLNMAHQDLRWFRLTVSGAALVALAFVGHAADGAGMIGAARVLILAAHLLAVAAWLGALPLLWRALRSDAPPPLPLLRRFGLIGGVCVALVLVTGLMTLGFMLAGAHGRLGPTYIATLALKLGFVIALFGLAGLNRFRLTPRMAREQDAGRRLLRRSIVLEQVLGLGALASVALLGQLDPTM